VAGYCEYGKEILSSKTRGEFGAMNNY